MTLIQCTMKLWSYPPWIGILDILDTQFSLFASIKNLTLKLNPSKNW